jgi:hypothetical protein
MPKIKLCKEPGCKNAAVVEGYCRLHYIKNWKMIKRKRRTTAVQRLNKYVETLMKKYPDKYVDIIREDIRSGRFENAPPDSYYAEIDEVYNIFNDPGYEAEVEALIKNLKSGGKP